MISPSEEEVLGLAQWGATADAGKQISALRAQAMAAQREIAMLRDKVGALERELRLRSDLSFDGQFYWMGSAHEKEGPFCPTCYDAERLLMRLQYRTVEEIDYETGATRPGGQVYYQCLHCSRKSRRDIVG